ncbi:hypothetical protein [Agromyces badenianii]|uniref:hypothetical protein n=1 Tax=Agromyces badenianii TaxID=2080742 RepID=UPI000D58F49A|nr:hypothetical protein [Agromyces badenianii]PWC05211.1 hypothetical protein DCE94_02615 [Agromyces badenianii]
MSLSRSATRHGRSTVAALAAAGALALLLSGCTSGDPAPSPTSSPDAAEPIFASDEEALAAAVEAYEAYISVAAEIGEDGGSHPERVLSVVSDEYSTDAIAEYENLASHGYRVVGRSTIDTTSLVDRTTNGPTTEVTIYGCVGVGTTRVLDSTGRDITPADRDEKVPLVLVFEGPDKHRLTLAKSDLWTGSDFC